MVKLCWLKFSFLLFEMVYDIEKLRKQFKYLTKFAKNCKFNSDFPLGKMLDKFLMEKPSPPLRNLVIFSKEMVTRNNDFSSKNHQKVQKYWKSKNGVKTALTPLFKELWAIYVFFTNLKFDDYQKHQRKPAKVQKSWRI